MKWIRVEKFFRGGSTTNVLYFDDYAIADEIVEAVESWAKRSPGGHAYGYSLKWKEVKITKKVILEKIRGAESRIEGYFTSIQACEEDIKKLQTELLLTKGGKRHDKKG